MCVCVCVCVLQVEQPPPEKKPKVKEDATAATSLVNEDVGVADVAEDDDVIPKIKSYHLNLDDIPVELLPTHQEKIMKQVCAPLLHEMPRELAAFPCVCACVRACVCVCACACVCMHACVHVCCIYMYNVYIMYPLHAYTSLTCACLHVHVG